MSDPSASGCPSWCIADHAHDMPGIRLHRSAEIVIPVSGDLELAAGLLPLTEILGDEIADAILAGLERLWLEIHLAGITHDDG